MEIEEVGKQCEFDQSIIYDDHKIVTGYRLDMLVEDCVIIENKSVNNL